MHRLAPRASCRRIVLGLFALAATAVPSAAAPPPVEELAKFLPVRTSVVQVAMTDEGLALTAGGAAMTAREYKVPLRIDFVAQTNGTNVRLYYGQRGEAIFNWELDQENLRYHDPVDGAEKHQPGKGRVPANQWVTFTWMLSETRARLLVNGTERASIAGKYRGFAGSVGIGPASDSKVVVKSVRIRSEGLDDGAGIGVKSAEKDAAASGKPAYVPPDLNVSIFDAQKLKLPLAQRREAAQALSDHVLTVLPLDKPEGLQMAARMLGIALRLDPDNRSAVVANARLRRGEPPAPTTMPSASQPAARQLAARLVPVAQACQASESADDRALAAYLYALVLLADPSNDDATYQSERLSQAGVRPSWAWAGGPAEDPPPSPTTDVAVPRGDPGRKSPIARRQSSIKGLAVVGAPNGQLVGVSSDVIATVLPSDEHNGARFARDAGKDMSTALEEAIRVVRVRHPTWDDADIQISFEDKYSKQDGGSAGTAFAVVLLSLFEGFEVDPQTAITGDITVDWKTRKVGGVDAKIRAAVAAGSKYVVIPQENAERIADYLVLNGPKGLWEIQVLSAATLNDAVATVRTDREAALAEALKLFAEIQGECGGTQGAVYLNTAAAKEKLDRVLAAAPNHLSARYLRLVADRKHPTRLSIGASLYQAFVAVYPLRDVLWGGAMPNRSNFTESIAGDVRRQLREQRRTCNERVAPLVNAIQDFVDAASRATTPAGQQVLRNRRQSVLTELERLQAQRETFEELIRKGM